MSALVSDDDSLASGLHRILEHLTVLKLQVDMVQLSLERGELERAEIGVWLDEMTHELDAMVARARTFQAEPHGTT
jgi:hypothetical protein